jgi:hypothetical protein
MQTDSPTVSTTVRALEAAWARIAEVHPDLPHACIVVGSGVEGGRYSKHGHWWPETWTDKADGARHEVLIASERLSDGGEWAFETLLHEAVHALAHVRGIKDTSRRGRYHNKRFAALAEDLGLEVEKNKTYGHVTTGLKPDAKHTYASTIARVEDAIAAYRKRPGAAAGEEKEKRPKTVTLTCPCERTVKVPEDFLEAGGLTCQACGGDFA